jgi:hypothetical protein
MTGSDAEKDRRKAEKHAAMHYFRKPSTLVEFMHPGVIAREILGRRNPADSTSRQIQSIREMLRDAERNRTPV